MDYERVAIGHAIDNRSMKRAYDLGLRPKFFVDPIHRDAYTKILEYWLANQRERTYTLAMLKEDFPEGDWDECKNPEESVDWVVEHLKDRHTTNRIQDAIREAAEEASSGSPREALVALNQNVVQIQRDTSERLSRSDLSENVDVRRARYAERSAFDGQIKGIPTGFQHMDDHTFGLLPGELQVVVAYAGVGKSTYLVNTLCEARRAPRSDGKIGYTGILFTLELSVPEMEDKIDAKISGLSHQRLQRGQLTNEEVGRLRAVQDEYASYGPMYVEKPPRGERSVQALVNRAREVGADFMLIDQLSFMEPKRSYQKKFESIEDIMFDLKAEISENESAMIPCFLAAQFNRESMSTKKGRGGIHQIALSSSVEQCADMAIGLSSTREQRLNNTVIMDMLKFRRGAAESWQLHWEMSDSKTLFESRDPKTHPAWDNEDGD